MLNNMSFSKQLWFALSLGLVMLLTRGSHMLTPFSLPDASIILFLLGGLWLRGVVWFALMFVLAAVIDFGAAAIDPAQGFCLTDGYWGMVPTYAVMWVGGLWLAKQAKPFAMLPFVTVSLLTSAIAFVISTQSYYLFSGRFPQAGLWSSLQHGWEYLPAWMLYTVVYIGLVFVGRQLAIWLKFPLLESSHVA